MSADNKHLAAVLLGAAAAFGAYKYTHMTDEEKQKMSDAVKDKFHKLKAEAESAGDSAKNYFGDLKDKAAGLLKEHFPDVEKHFEDFFKGPSNEATSTVNSTPAES